jgi:hypothetical protein
MSDCFGFNGGYLEEKNPTYLSECKQIVRLEKGSDNKPYVVRS